MTDPAITLALGCGVGVAVGFVLSLLGAGGSVLATPLLIYAVGVTNPQIAIGTSSCGVAASAAIGAFHHARAGTVRWRIALPFTLGGVLGAFFGSMIAKLIPGRSLLALFGLLMAYIALRMVRSRTGPLGDVDQETMPRTTVSRQRVILHGAAAGSLSGFFGVGGGFLCVPAILAAADMSMVQAVGSSLVAITAFGLTSMASYASSGLVDWPLAAAIISGGVAGTSLGTNLGRVIGGQDAILRKAFGGVLALAALRILLDASAPLFKH